jgi:tetratricopeptide (TPR) repeat protein
MLSKKKKQPPSLTAEISALLQRIAELQAQAYSGSGRGGPRANARRNSKPSRAQKKEQQAAHKSPKPKRPAPAASSLQTSAPSAPEQSPTKLPLQYTPVYELTQRTPVEFHSGLALAKDAPEAQGAAAGLFSGLFDRARLQWLMHDWESLAQLDLQGISQDPDRAAMSLLAASALVQLGRYEKAKEYISAAQDWGCERKLLTASLAAGICLNLARAHALAGRVAKATRMLTKSIPGQPSGNRINQLWAMHSLKGVQTEVDPAPDESSCQSDSSELAFLQNASARLHRRKHTPSSAEKAKKLNANGEVLFAAGQFKMAAEYFQRAVNLQPRDAWFCQNLAEAVARLDMACAKQWECTELGDAIAAAGKWEIAVRYYRMALGISSSTVEAHRQAQTFKVEAPREGHVHRPVFIAGCGHSGTSVMLAMLGSHPNLHAIPKETALFLRTDQAMQEAMRQFDVATKEAGKERWVEKTPPHLFQIHRFLAMRPGSRFIIMLRDGRDVVCSLKHREGYLSVKDRVERWIYDNMAAESFRGHPQVTFVKYEELVGDTENTLRQLCDFLDEQFTESLLRFHETPRRWYSDYIDKPTAITSHQEHNANRNWQINQPLFDGRGRWQQQMSAEEKEYFRASPAQNLLVRLGYAEDAVW